MMAGEEDAASDRLLPTLVQPLPLRPLIDGGTLRFVVSHANEKFEANAKRTAMLEEAFDTMVLKEQELEAAAKGAGEAIVGRKIAAAASAAVLAVFELVGASRRGGASAMGPSEAVRWKAAAARAAAAGDFVILHSN